MHSNQVIATLLQRLGQDPPPGGIELRPMVLFNPRMLSATFVVPGLIGVILQQETLILTAQAIVREREIGTLEQLAVTPVRPWELMVGKCIPYLAIALATVAITLGIARVVFGISVAGSVVQLFALSLLFLIGSLATGLMISAIARSEMEARQLADLFLLPAILLTGFIFPRESMPAPAQAVGLLLPLTYFLQVLRGIILKGVGIEVLWPQLVPLAVYALIALAASAVLFKKRAA
jgi:ABC-2 type transport system permease protein